VALQYYVYSIILASENPQSVFSNPQSEIRIPQWIDLYTA